MPAFERYSPNFIKHFIGRIKVQQNFTPKHVVESNGVLSIQRSLSDEDEDSKKPEEPFHKSAMFNYGFEMASIPVVFGRGFTKDVGYEVKKFNPKNPLIVTDRNVFNTKAFKAVHESIKAKLQKECDVFQEISCEPTNKSLFYAIEIARSMKYDCFIAVGGGSVMDTARIANLFASNSSLDVSELDNPPFSDGKYLVKRSINKNFPLISVPTTFSLNSESAGGLRYHIEGKNQYGVICNDDVKPNLIIADPLNVLSVPKHVAANGAFDLLIHALEAFTLKTHTPHISNMPYITGTELQTIFNLTNILSDDWAVETLKIMKKYLKRAVLESEDVEARSHLLLASTFAGIGFRNPTIRLCHTLSYPIRSLGKHFSDSEYGKSNTTVPHGLAVAMTAPAAFKLSAYADPERHLEAARLLGANVNEKATPHEIGTALADILRSYMRELHMPNGLSELGFKFDDLFKLSDLAVDHFKTSPSSSKEMDKETLREIYEDVWKIY